jgi:hypothetical protein
MKLQRTEVLPYSLPPLGINREQAASLVGISTSLFDKAVLAGTMPKPRMIGERQVYDVGELAEAFRKLPHKGGEDLSLDGLPDGGNPWD